MDPQPRREKKKNQESKARYSVYTAKHIRIAEKNLAAKKK